MTEKMEQRLKEFLKEECDDEELIGIVHELNSYNGDLENLTFYSVDDDFDELTYGLKPSELAQRIFYGDFNPNHPYWSYDGYGNFASFNYYDAGELCRDCIDDIISSIDGIPYQWLPSEIQSIYDEGEGDEEEEEGENDEE